MKPDFNKRYTVNEFNQLFAGGGVGSAPSQSARPTEPSAAGGLLARLKAGVNVTLTTDEAIWLHDEYQRIIQERDYWKGTAALADRAALREAVEAGPEEP